MPAASPRLPLGPALCGHTSVRSPGGQRCIPTLLRSHRCLAFTGVTWAAFNQALACSLGDELLLLPRNVLAGL